jgi:hypothetical protein
VYKSVSSPQLHDSLSVLWNSLTHVTIILLAIGIAFSLPVVAEYVLYDWWPRVQTETNLLLATEVGLSAVLVLLFNALKAAWSNRRVITAARQASLVYAMDSSLPPSRQWAKRLVKRSSTARDISILTLTGFDTFVTPDSPFNDVIATAYEIRVMLLNPASEAASRRVDAIPDQDVNLQSLREEIAASIAYLTSLHKVDKRVRLKFYDHEPVWKVVVLNDHVWVQHCHRGLEVKRQPEYVFALQSGTPRGGFFTPFYMYFLDHWNEPHYPEYDFDTRELIYRDKTGNETKRAPLPALHGSANPPRRPLPAASLKPAMEIRNQ